MPRYAREKSETGIYHVMLRGIARMKIFHGKQDKIRFLEIIDRMKKDGEYHIYAYCLMDNHIHLLVKEEKDPLARSVKRIGVSYAYYFNKKYDRVGHVFQGRFRSEPIEDDRHLMAAVRYIHNNPVVAGIVGKAADYLWSSYHEYINCGVKSGRVNTTIVMEMFASTPEKAVAEFVKFSEQKGKEEFIDIDDEARKSEKDINSAEDIIENILEGYGCTIDEIRNLESKQKRDEIIRGIKSNSPLSIRELSRLLKVSKDIIYRA